MSHTALTYHLVFGTWNRHSTIHPAHDRELYKFIYDFASARGVHIWRIGGMPDHVHILCDLPPSISVAAFMKLIKTETSKFMRANPHFPRWDRWADGYGAFTKDPGSRQACIDYIMQQKTHHAGTSFEAEYRRLLTENGLPAE